MAEKIPDNGDHAAANLDTPVQLDGKNCRKDLNKGNEDPCIESHRPLMMFSNATPNTYTNDVTEEDNNGCDNVMLQDLSRSPTKHIQPIVIPKKEGRNVDRNYNNASSHPNINGWKPVHNGVKDTSVNDDRDHEARGYAKPSSIFDQIVSVNDYVKEDEDGSDIIETTGSNGYLTPSEIVNSQFSSFDVHTPTVASRLEDENPHPRPVNERGVRINRFDSGVGDCENSLSGTSHSMSSAGSFSNPRLSSYLEEHYESIDYYSKEYKKRRDNNKNFIEKNQNIPKLNELQPPPRVNLSGVTQTDSDDQPDPAVCVSNTQLSPPRAHERACADGTLPHMYSHLNIETNTSPLKKKETNNCCGHLLMCLFVIIFFVSMASLGISLYVLLSRDDNSHSNNVVFSPSTSSSTESPAVNITHDLTQDIQQLKSQVEDLKKENLALRNALDLYIKNSSSSLHTLTEKIDTLIISQKNTSLKLQAATKDLRSEIANISLTPGPQGPQGVGNFSLCELKTSTFQLPASMTEDTNTEYSPEADFLENYITLFAFCSYSGAQRAVLNYRIRSKKVQYRCTCSGKLENENQTLCTLHYLICPRINGNAL